MSRCLMSKGDQSRFLHHVLDKLNLSPKEIGARTNLSSRTIRDWIREKYLASYEVLLQLSQISNVPLPKIIETRDEYWSAKQFAQKGGFATQKKYGSLLTMEARRKGGLNSSWKRQGTVFIHPSLDDENFAEFIGIVLGDGGLTHSQLSITLNRIADHEYIHYVSKLITSLFDHTPSIAERKHACATTITISSVNIIKFLVANGLIIGNKVKQQVGVPTWVNSDINLSKMCVRGLMDTDGCMFINRYKINGKEYAYRKTAFANRSQPILKFVYNTLQQVGLHPIYYQGIQIRLCSEKETFKYLDLIGSSNPRIKNICS